MAFPEKNAAFLQALLLTVTVTNTFSNSHGQAFMSQVLLNLQGKIPMFPFLIFEIQLAFTHSTAVTY